MDKAASYLGTMFSSPLSFDRYFLISGFNIYVPLTFGIDLLHRTGYLTGKYNTLFLMVECSVITALIMALGNFGSVEFIYFQF
jgi:hypothetical protein